MDKNSITGFVLIAVILIGYSYFIQPSPEELEKIKLQRDSIAQIETQKRVEIENIQPVEEEQKAVIKESEPSNIESFTEAQLDSLENALAFDEFGDFAPAAKGENQFYTLENDKIIATLSSKGGKISKVVLKDYKTYSGEEVALFSDSVKFNLNFFSKNRLINTSDLYFEAKENTISENGEEIKVIEMTAKTASDGKYITYEYRLGPDNYLVDVAVKFAGMQDELQKNAGEISLNWKIWAPSKEKNIETERRASTVYFKYKNDESDYISESSFEKLNLEASVSWVSFKQQFFNASIISEKGFDKANSDVETKEINSFKYIKEYNTNLTLLMDESQMSVENFTFYFGPNHYQTLKALDIGLESQIDLGWTIIGWINRWLIIPVFNFLDGFNLNYGIIILLLTIFIKLIISPLTYKNYISSAKQKVLKPEMDALNEKMKNEDPMKKQQAVMGLYREAGVNPMAGCIPMLLQMPILFAMFKFFPSSIELRQEGFLWAEDLSTYDSIFELPFSIPFYGAHVSLFTILLAISTFLYTKYNTQMTMSAGPQAAQMKIMTYMMPFMMLFFFNSFSAGLSYYYFLSNIMSVVQQLVIKRFFIDEEAIHRKIQANKSRPKAQKKSGFQKRLEDMAKKRGINPNEVAKKRK